MLKELDKTLKVKGLNININKTKISLEAKRVYSKWQKHWQTRWVCVFETCSKAGKTKPDSKNTKKILT